MTYEEFSEYLEEEFPEDWDFDWPEAESLGEGMEYVFSTGGKRLRPFLCLKMCEAIGGEVEEAKVFARAIEIFHNFTLVHDDIMDGDSERRNQETVWKRYGEAEAINIGNALHVSSYDYLVSNSGVFEQDTFNLLLELFSSTAREVIDGQSMDLEFRDRDDIEESEYLTMVQKKTGALISAALKGGAIVAGADHFTLEEVDAYARAIGPAFQIRDDVIDIVGEKGRDRGNDIREGKRSLIVVKALQRLEEDEKDELLEILDAPREENSDEDVERAVELFESVDAVKDANRVADELANDAKEILGDLEERHRIDDIEAVTDFLVDRKF